MALADRWLLPDGVKDILPPRARQIEAQRRQLLDLYDSWGYDMVMPPLVEHLDSLLTGVGRDLDLDTFKLTDQISGHQLGIRADITPQVARIDAHRLRNEGTSRFCYAGSVLHTRAAHMLAPRNPLQLGVEMYGQTGIESDLEVISLMLETLLVAGIKTPLSLDLGHVALFASLVDECDLTAQQQSDYLDMLQRKALPEIDAFVDSLELNMRLADLLRQLPRLHGGVSVLARARELFGAANAQAEQALTYLEQLAERLAAQYPQVTLYFDLSDLRGYKYHTGVVFAAYTPAFGQVLAQGGRYDNIGRDFGRARPATGFSTDLKTLAELADWETTGPQLILAPALADADLQAKVRELRAAGNRVRMLLSDADIETAQADARLLKKDGEWVLQAL